MDSNLPKEDIYAPRPMLPPIRLLFREELASQPSPSSYTGSATHSAHSQAFGTGQRLHGEFQSVSQRGWSSTRPSSSQRSGGPSSSVLQTPHMFHSSRFADDHQYGRRYTTSPALDSVQFHMRPRSSASVSRSVPSRRLSSSLGHRVNQIPTTVAQDPITMPVPFRSHELYTGEQLTGFRRLANILTSLPPEERLEHEDVTPIAEYHRNVATPNPIPISRLPYDPPSAKYECAFCHKGFNRPSSLKIHLNSHTGEKPYACPVEGCGRSFSVLSNMRRHHRVHATASALDGNTGDDPPGSSSAVSSSSDVDLRGSLMRRGSNASSLSSSELSRRSHSVSSSGDGGED